MVHPDRMIRDKMTMREEISFDPNEFLDIGIPVDELRDDIRKQVVDVPRAVVDVHHEKRFDHTEQGQWWAKKKKTPPRTDALDAWVNNQAQAHSGKTVLVILLIATAGILCAVSFVL